MRINLPAPVTRAVYKQAFVLQKHSPRILFAAGVAGVVATTVSACRATLKVEPILDEHQKHAIDIKSMVVTEKERRREMSVLYFRTTTDVMKLYAPAITMGALSVAALTGSHNILSKRNAGLTAAYAASEKAYQEYRGRVVEELGEDKDREFAYGSENRTIVKETKDGPKKEKVKSFGHGMSPYSKIFDEYNQNWCRTPEYNIAFLKLQQNYLNDRLRARGHVFLNEVYEQLGFEHTPAGAVTGWLWDPKDKSRDSYINFGCWANENMNGFLDFLQGREDGIMLDFNVDGPIYKDI